MKPNFLSSCFMAVVASVSFVACGGGDLPPGSTVHSLNPNQPGAPVQVIELPPGQTEADASNCFNPALYLEGARIASTSIAAFGAGDVVQVTTETAMGAGVSYQGNQIKQATEILSFLPQSAQSATGQTQKTTAATRYLTADVSTKCVRDYGFGAKSTPTDSTAFATVIDTNYSPFVKNRFGLQFGLSFNQTFTESSKVTNPDASTSTNAKKVVKTVLFAGMEEVKLASGTFAACKFQESGTTTDAQSNTHLALPMKTSWIGRKNGLLLKSITETPMGKSLRTDTVELQSAAINGVAVKP